jgi:hypothetical protein
VEDLELLEDSEQAEITKLDYKLKTCEERA